MINPLRRDADAWLTQTEADLRRGDWLDPDVGRMPFELYAKRWLTESPSLRAR